MDHSSAWKRSDPALSMDLGNGTDRQMSAEGMEEMNRQVEQFLPLVDFIAQFMGENTEVALLDLTDWTSSVVAIHNGHISGRQVGSPVTETSLQALKAAAFDNAPYLVNYETVAKNGHPLKSSSYFIREGEQIVGMLCVNIDYNDLITARNLLNTMVASEKIPFESDQSQGMGDTGNVQELVSRNFLKVMPEGGGSIQGLSQNEKIAIVGKLSEMGTFMVKGAVSYVAQNLGVSVPTIYRYINLLKKDQQKR